MYIVLLSIHGLIRTHDLELGRDADTGGQTLYVVGLARALAERDDVDQVDLTTRRIVDPAVSVTMRSCPSWKTWSVSTSQAKPTPSGSSRRSSTTIVLGAAGYQPPIDKGSLGFHLVFLLACVGMFTSHRRWHKRIFEKSVREKIWGG